MSTTSSTSSNSALLALSGLSSGIDWQSLVTQLVAVERSPETQMTAQQTGFQTEKTAYQTIGTKLTALGTDLKNLSSPNFFSARNASVSDASVASATAATGTAQGSYTFNVSQLASDAVMQGASASGKPLSATNDVSGLVLSGAGFAHPVTAGTFTVNGQQVTIATSDTLQSVFDKISTATGGAVTGSYNASADEITLTGSGPIILGSATDTSNFLQTAKLYNNGTNTISSTSALGGVNLNSTDAASSNLATTINDGGSGNGQFLINGVTINYNTANDNLNNILTRINNSAAGVTATYDPVNNRFLLTNKTAGDIGISLSDVTGNFLAATGLSGGTLQRGTNLQYSVNNGGTLTSQTNTITSDTSGITGLTVNALSLGSTVVNVGSDTSTIATAITGFVNDYNAVQTYISSQTATSTDSSGNVTAGTLTGNMDIEGIATQLRQLMNSAPGGASSVIQSLNDLGFVSNGHDNTLDTSNTSALTAALTSNLTAVQSLFTDTASGFGKTIGAYVTNLTGTSGILATTENDLTSQSADITKNIANLEIKVTADQTRLTQEFVAMETAVNTINQQKQYLNSYFGASTSTNSGSTSASGI